jgi:probable rRNA maturation factor
MSQHQIEVYVVAESVDDAPEIERLIARAVATTLDQEQVSAPVSVTLILAGDEKLRQLNCEFLGLDEPTDVLSFPAGEPMPAMADEAGHYLGDIAISVPRAAAQAAAAGHSMAAELQLLTVHGVLHLLGHDHVEPVERGRMWRAQTEALQRLGVAITAPPVE